MQIYLSVTPSQVSAAMPYTHNLAHVAYRIGAGGQLHRLRVDARGGLLSLSDRDAPPIGSDEALCGELLRECNRQGYAGVVADFEEMPTPDRSLFLTHLAALLRRNRRVLYVPEGYTVPGAIPLLCTALSGGSLQERLSDGARDGRPLALDVQRMAMDFPLPSPTGEGCPLSRTELEALLAERQSFYSPTLCAKYCTYVRGGETHFVLYDDAATLLQKLRLGRQIGAQAAFLMFPEVEDLLPALFSPPERKK
ncbi:MAG: hypothetical protein RRY95_03960 [Oscillospiraceae bacterium]